MTTPDRSALDLPLPDPRADLLCRVCGGHGFYLVRGSFGFVHGHQRCECTRPRPLAEDPARLRAALHKHGAHTLLCPARELPPEPCTCGWSALLDELETGGGPRG